MSPRVFQLMFHSQRGAWSRLSPSLTDSQGAGNLGMANLGMANLGMANLGMALKIQALTAVRNAASFCARETGKAVYPAGSLRSAGTPRLELVQGPDRPSEVGAYSQPSSRATLSGALGPATQGLRKTEGPAAQREAATAATTASKQSWLSRQRSR